MNHRSKLIWLAGGAALANLSWLGSTVLVSSSAPRSTEQRITRAVGEPPYEATLGRLIECGATRIWLEDQTTHVPPVWVLELSRANQSVVACFDARTVSRAAH